MEEAPFLETWQAFPWNGAQYIESSGFQTRAEREDRESFPAASVFPAAYVCALPLFSG